MEPLYIPPPKGDVARGVADGTFAHVRDDLTWLEVAAARKEYFMSSSPRSYRYKTWDGEREYHSAPFTVPVFGLLEALRMLPQVLPTQAAALGLTALDFNVCFLNRYDTQHGHLGWHADDSPEMSHDHPIAVVSLGAEREIWWKPKTEKGETPPERRRLLEHGSVFVMPAGFQRDHLHRIPKCDRAVGTRISLTFRHYLDKEDAGVHGLPPPATG
jgi:alkylated DNA repair dioxygenase AlkB